MVVKVSQKTRVYKKHAKSRRLVCALADCALDNLPPADQAPMLLNSPAQSNLVAILCADWVRQRDFCQIVLLDAENTTAGSGRANVDHENFTLLQLGHLAGLSIA